jgi:polar amino acid transport system substrate-binding protein
MLEIAKLILVVNIMMITMNKILNPINKCGTFFIILSFLCFGLSSNVYAQKTIKVAFGNALAPWVFPQDNNGIIVDIISEALRPLGYKIEYIYVPYARRINSYKSGIVDVASDMNIKTVRYEKLEGHLSDEAYVYQNYAFALAKNKFNFQHLNELVNLNLVSWQGAIAHLGNEYAVMASKNPFYQEIHDQEAQIKMLFAERAEVIQLDLQIFKYYRANVAKNTMIDTDKSVQRFPLFGRSPNVFLFKDKTIRDEFNKRLAIMKENGEYKTIFDRYTCKGVAQQCD